MRKVSLHKYIWKMCSSHLITSGGVCNFHTSFQRSMSPEVKFLSGKEDRVKIVWISKKWLVLQRTNYKASACVLRKIRVKMAAETLGHWDTETLGPPCHLAGTHRVGLLPSRPLRLQITTGNLRGVTCMACVHSNPVLFSISTAKKQSSAK